MGETEGPSLTCRSLLFVSSSLEAFGLLGTTKGFVRGEAGMGRGGGTGRERAPRPSTDKAEEERTSLQVNSEEQLAWSRGKLRFQTINDHSLLHSNKDVDNTVENILFCTKATLKAFIFCSG